MCVRARVWEHGVRLFLRSSSRSEPDAPSEPHHRKRSYYHCRHVVQQPIRALG